MTIDGKMAGSTKMADGHTVKKLAEKMGSDALGGIGHKGDDSFDFATLFATSLLLSRLFKESH